MVFENMRPVVPPNSCRLFLWDTRLAGCCFHCPQTSQSPASLGALNPESPLSAVILALLVYLSISCYHGKFGSREWNTALKEGQKSFPTTVFLIFSHSNSNFCVSRVQSAQCQKPQSEMLRTFKNSELCLHCNLCVLLQEPGALLGL